QRRDPRASTEWRCRSLAKHLEGSVPLNGGAIIGPAAAPCRGPSSIPYWIWARGADVRWQCASAHDMLPANIKPNMARPRFRFPCTPLEMDNGIRDRPVPTKAKIAV